MVINGNEISLQIKNEIKDEVVKLNNINIYPKLSVISVGHNPASAVYIRNKKLACAQTNIENDLYELEESTDEDELLNLIDTLNNDKNVHGILVQLPLPPQINVNKVLLKIKQEKDVDCFNPYNVGLLHANHANLMPCTPCGILELLKHLNIKIQGANCVVIGRSNIVGKPMAAILINEDATVTVAHSKTHNLEKLTQDADILIVAVGQINFIKEHMIKEGAVIIDVGINRRDGKIYGDVDFDGVKQKAGYITPVPGGVGPMTIAMLMKNCLTACKSQTQNENL